MSKWIKIEKRTPTDDRQVFALSGQCSYLACYRDGNWWLTNTMRLGSVTRWMEIPGEPKDLEYWLNRLRGWWKQQRTNVQEASDYFSGWTSRTAQLGKKPVFYKDASGKIMSGLPEHLPAPRGFQKIVCNSAAEAERFSSLQRQQEQHDHRRQQYERGGIEEEMRSEIRSERRELIRNARNAVNRDFLIAANERFDKQQKPWQYERESFLHAEGYEDRR